MRRGKPSDRQFLPAGEVGQGAIRAVALRHDARDALQYRDRQRPEKRDLHALYIDLQRVNSWVVLQDTPQLVFSVPAAHLDIGLKSTLFNIDLAAQGDPSVAAAAFDAEADAAVLGADRAFDKLNAVGKGRKVSLCPGYVRRHRLIGVNLEPSVSREEICRTDADIAAKVDDKAGIAE